MASELRIGIIGLGNIGRMHLRVLQETPNVRVVGVVDKTPRSELGLPDNVQLFSEWSELTDHPGVDAVIICLPHWLHAPCASRAIENGKHVFLEKPIATAYKDAVAMVALAKERRRTLMVNMTHRFYPVLRKARELLRAGHIGEIISVRDYYMEIINRAEFPAWFFDPKAAGGGVVLTDSVHLVDRIGWLLDKPITFIAGMERRMMPDSAVEDCAEILCRAGTEIPVTIGSFFFTGNKTWEDGLTLFGTLGSMRIHAWSHLEWAKYGEPMQRVDGYDSQIPMQSRPAVGHRAALLEFVQSLRENRIPEANAATVLNAHQVVHEFYQQVSCNTGD